MEWIERLEPESGPWTRNELEERRSTDPEVIAAAVREIGLSPTAWAVETATRVVTRLRGVGGNVVPRNSTGHDLEGCENGLLTALAALRRGSYGRDVIVSDAMLDVARIAFRQGLPLDVLTHRIWASHAASQDEMLAAIDRLVPPDQHLKVIQRMNQVMFTYGNTFVSTLTEAYEAERRAWRGRLPQERRRVVLEVAEGAAPPAEAEEVLGASLIGGHLHALVWSAHAGYVANRESHVDDWALGLADSLGARRMVSFERDSMVQVWWSFTAAPPEDAASVIAAATRPPWLRVALGPAGTGLEGFRASHDGATVAAAVGKAAHAGDFWDYDRVALLGLAIADRRQAARFVRRVLGGLVAPGERFAELRETVRLYLAEGNSRLAVAKGLHVAPTTVAYRVSQAGTIIGEAVSARPAEVQLALELVHHFPDLVGLTPDGQES